MGRSIHVQEHDFFIAKQNIAPLLEKLLKHEHAYAESLEIEGLDRKSDFDKVNQIIENTWGFSFNLDHETGIICGISFVWEKMIGDEYDFMELIAEFVQESSSITMYSGELWRYSFENKKCVHLIPQIYWVEHVKTPIKKEAKVFAKKTFRNP